MLKVSNQPFNETLRKSLQKDALQIRKNLLKMHFEAQAGHLGTGLSCIEVLTYIYRIWMRSSPSTRLLDQFVLSKGHGASALYATLHFYGFFSDQLIQTYYKEGTLLPAHPVARAFEVIPAATGSLGHGFSIANGMAYANQYLHNHDHDRVAVLLSDGECNEGSTWEAALFAAHHRLQNLTVIVDANGLQGFGRTDEVMGLEPFCEKWKAFGFSVQEVNGHDFDELHSAFQTAFQTQSLQPLCILARTVKGKGVSFMENKLEWHYLPPEERQYQEALQELEHIEKELS